ncbi:hypothetical protein DFH06DRAFT_253961 [Mycena polygramma]|nr:hypothetical protein DFH06DRAFT_253961 [Mycena polygramma]
MPKKLALTAFDESLPSPLTSRNLRPRVEASLRSSSSRGGSARSSRPSSSLSNSFQMSPSSTSSRVGGSKRERSASPAGVGRKRARAASEEEEEEQVDELEDDVPPQPLNGSGTASRLREAKEPPAQENEVPAAASDASQTSGPSVSSSRRGKAKEIPTMKDVPDTTSDSSQLQETRQEAEVDASASSLRRGKAKEISVVEDVADTTSDSSQLQETGETRAQEAEVETILLSPEPGAQDFSADLEKRLSRSLTPSKVPSPESKLASGSNSSSKPIKTSRSPSPPLIISSPVASGSKLQPSPPPSRPEPEPLSAYSCPICFFPPTNATLTPCGHVCCGACLFTAVKTMAQRGAMLPEASVARCPVCRAQIPGWDGRGGGVIGLKVRAVFSL